MARPYSKNEGDYDQIARHWVSRRNARRYFRRAASKSRRVGLRRDTRKQMEEV